MQDHEIVSLYFDRNETAITATSDKYGRYLTKIAYNITADDGDSEESVNDTYLAAWNTIPPHAPDILSTFLSKLTRRIAIDIVRKRSRVKRRASEYALSIDELSDCASPDTPEKELDAKLLAGAISDFLRTLPVDTRNAFVCRYYFLDQMSVIAAKLDMSEAKLKSLMHRTRLALREYLKKEGFYI